MRAIESARKGVKDKEKIGGLQRILGGGGDPALNFYINKGENE